MKCFFDLKIDHLFHCFICYFLIFYLWYDVSKKIITVFLIVLSEIFNVAQLGVGRVQVLDGKKLLEAEELLVFKSFEVDQWIPPCLVLAF